MKILKVKVKREKIGNRTHSIYPSECSVRWTMYEGEIFQEGTEEFQYRVGFTTDEKADYLVNKYPDKFEILSKESAIAYCEQYDPMPPAVIDGEKAISVLRKIKDGKKLSSEEMDSIDEAKPGGIVHVKKSWNDRFTEQLADVELDKKLKIIHKI